MSSTVGQPKREVSICPHAPSKATAVIERESVVDILRSGGPDGKLSSVLAGFTGRDRAKITGGGFPGHIERMRKTYAELHREAAILGNPRDAMGEVKASVSELKIALPAFFVQQHFLVSSRRFPWTGLSRSAMNALILPTPENGCKPPVKSFVLRKRGAKTGVRLINWDSLTAYIYTHEEKGLPGTRETHARPLGDRAGDFAGPTDAASPQPASTPEHNNFNPGNKLNKRAALPAKSGREESA